MACPFIPSLYPKVLKMLVGWLVGWLVGCLVGWLVGWLFVSVGPCDFWVRSKSDRRKSQAVWAVSSCSRAQAADRALAFEDGGRTEAEGAPRGQCLAEAAACSLATKLLRGHHYLPNSIGLQPLRSQDQRFKIPLKQMSRTPKSGSKPPTPVKFQMKPLNIGCSRWYLT